MAAFAGDAHLCASADSQVAGTRRGLHQGIGCLSSGGEGWAKLGAATEPGVEAGGGEGDQGVPLDPLQLLHLPRQGPQAPDDIPCQVQHVYITADRQGAMAWW